MFLLYSLGVGALFPPALALVLFIRELCQTKFPTSRVKEFLSRASAGPVAHRGGYPENTITAFRRAKSQGASGIEVDLVFSKDSHPVLFHDPTVDRTSNGSGKVTDLTLEQLKSLDVGLKSGSEFAGEQVPTLTEALAVCEELDLLMFLELKGDTEKSIALIKKLFSEQPSLYNRVAVISFYPTIIYKLRKSDSNLLLGLVHRSGYNAYQPNGKRRNPGLLRHALSVLADIVLGWSIRVWLWRFLGISLLLVNKNDVLQGRVPLSVWEERNMCLVAWTVNSTEEKDHFEQVLKIPYLTDYVSSDDAHRPVGDN